MSRGLLFFVFMMGLSIGWLVNYVFFSQPKDIELARLEAERDSLKTIIKKDVPRTLFEAWRKEASEGNWWGAETYRELILAEKEIQNLQWPPDTLKTKPEEK